MEWAATGAAPAAFLGASELRAGFSRAYASWTCPADGGAWEPRTSHLFWGPGRAGVRWEGGRVVLGLAVVSDGRGGAWVELGELLWPLEEDDAARDALCRDVVGCPYDEVYAAARGDEALRAGLARQKQLARYFVEQVRTLSEMVRTRSYKVARVVEKEWSYGLLVSSMVDSRLPAAARAALVRLLHHLYLDRYPHEENCGKAQLPEQIVVVDPTSALYPQSDPVLLHFALDCAEFDRRFWWSRPTFRNLELGHVEVDSAEFWTNRVLSSSSRSRAEELASKQSNTRTFESS